MGTSGQLGNNTTTSQSSPVQIGTSSAWAQIGCGYFTTAGIQSDGTLWTWGGNLFGALGLNTSTSYSSPVQVGALSTWAQVASSTDYYMAARKIDGTLWTWGRNASGQLGLGDTVNRSSPVQVGSASNWSAVSCGYSYTGALTSNGTLYMWGSGTQGQLGLNTLTSLSSPIQVGALSLWTQVACGYKSTLAIQSPGTLWSWGYNNRGQLGLGDTASRSSPTQVGALTTWSQVSCGQQHTVAIKTDGTLWSWGLNSFGQLGVGSAGTNILSPVQVGALSNWAQFSCGYNHVVALQSNGTLWAWGRNTNGQLGLNNLTNRSSPVQVGALSNWSYVTATLSNESFALLTA
jgi:alpha-tubulin suppressor-like RCC1 family protein